jgi:sec-independent protein translocase protein TatA
MFAFIGNIGPWELIFILLVALIVVGPGKLPEVAKGLGKAAREFKKATTGVQKEINDVINFDDDRTKAIKKDLNTIQNVGVSKPADSSATVTDNSEDKAPQPDNVDDTEKQS